MTKTRKIYAMWSRATPLAFAQVCAEGGEHKEAERGEAVAEHDGQAHPQHPPAARNSTSAINTRMAKRVLHMQSVCCIQRCMHPFRHQRARRRQQLSDKWRQPTLRHRCANCRWDRAPTLGFGHKAPTAQSLQSQVDTCSVTFRPTKLTMHGVSVTGRRGAEMAHDRTHPG